MEKPVRLTLKSRQLGKIPAEEAAKVVRRIVDQEGRVPRLDVAAFNSGLD